MIKNLLILAGVLFLLAVSSTESIFAQNRFDTEADKLFNLAAANHKFELTNLLILRGGGLIQIRDASSESIAHILGTRSEFGEAGYSENTALLFYSFEKEYLSIFLIDEKGVKAYEKTKISDQQINEAINNLRSSLGVNSLQMSRVPYLRSGVIFADEKKPKLSFDEAEKNITRLLIPPSVALELNTTKHLIVVPALGIGTVPFALLKPFDANSFLIDKLSITISPGLFDVGQNIRHWDSSFRNSLIVGNPYLATDPKWVIPNLPGAETEARAVAEMLKTKALIGKEATKQAIAEKAREAHFIYIASHGIADSDNPLTGGYLMLSGETFENGWWTAKEIQEMRLWSKLVILSACQTGLGKVHNAGIIGLSRAFQIAGAPRVVMSLWSVDDKATNELMQIFVKNLQSDSKPFPSEALRQAMIEIKKKRPKPSEWASFAVFGTPR